MKYIIPLFLSLLLLTSCGNSSPSTTETFTQLTTPSYSIQLFPGWTESKDQPKDISVASGSFETYISPSPKDGIYSSLTILREELLSPMTSKTYARENIDAAPKQVRDYVKIKESPITIAGIDTYLHIFEGRSSAQAVTKRFIQAYITDGGTKAFTLSFAISPNTQDTTSYENILATFQLK